MNIIIPERFKDTKLLEREAMFIGFMTLIGNEHGWEHQYNICPWDMGKMMNVQGLVLDSPKMDTLKEIFEFTYLNDENWMVKWKDFDQQSWYTYKGQGTLKHHKYKLTTERNSNMWAYLLGLFRGSKDLVKDSHKIFEHEDVYRHTMNKLEIDNFRIENRQRVTIESTP